MNMDQTEREIRVARLPDPADVKGLTAAQAEERYNEKRAVRPHETRTVGQIVRDNSLTLFNFVNLILVTLIAIFGDMRDTLFFGVALSTTLMGIIQELRAKRTLDRLSLLRDTKVEAVRDGLIVRVESSRVVPNDILRLRAGDQVIADCVCLHEQGLQVNEALITGEADEVDKHPDDALWSGSFVTAGAAYVKVTAVGQDSFAARLSHEAKKEKKAKSRLVQSLRNIIRVLAVALAPMGIILFLSHRSDGQSLDTAVTGTAAALIGMIPQGLILLTNVAFAVGVINLGKRQTMVQSLSCIEALARVDILCLDKTGTITGGDMTVSQVVPLRDDYTESDVARLLSRLMAVLPDDNATAAALRKMFPPDGGTSPQPIQVEPFSSSRKYCGAVFPDELLMLGAVSHMPLGDPSLRQRAEDLSRDGGRVLALAHGRTDAPSLWGIAFIVLEDAIRPEARDTFARFQDQGVTLKVISGDSAATVSGIARRAGIHGAEHSLDLSGFAAGPPEKGQAETKLTRRDARKTVFGRVSPWQKRALIRYMKANGHTVAMTGDGVNDVLALKEADCGVAMAGGSEAARAVSDLVLLTSDFSAMTAAVNEGRRVINNIEKMAALYLSKTIFSTLLALIFIFLGGPYPFAPIQLTMISTLTIGIPSFFLTMRPNYRPIKDNLLGSVAAGALPTALAVVFHVLLARGLGPLRDYSLQDVSTVCAFVTGVLGLALVCRAARPFDRSRGLMLAGVTTAFLVCFLCFPGVFRFSGLFGPVGLAAVLLSVSGFICVWLLRRLILLVIKRKK